MRSKMINSRHQKWSPNSSQMSFTGFISFHCSRKFSNLGYRLHPHCSKSFVDRITIRTQSTSKKHNRGFISFHCSRKFSNLGYRLHPHCSKSFRQYYHVDRILIGLKTTSKKLNREFISFHFKKAFKSKL